MSLVVLLLTALTAPITAPPQSANDLAVSVMIRSMSSSGRGYSTAGSGRGDEVIARVTTDANLCSFGSGDFALQRAHDYSWELTARVVSRAADTVTANVTWKQLEGPGSGGAPRSQTVVLKNGERAVLETIRPAGALKCAAEATLEVEAGARVGGGSGSTTGIGASGRARASGGTGGVGSTADRAGTVGIGAGGGSSAGAGGAVGLRDFALKDPQGALDSLPLGAPLTVEMWLVRTLPSGVERVEAHDRAENVSTIAKKFGPISIATPGGTVGVTVGVNLRTLARAKDPLSILINRDENADGKLGHGGMSRVSDIPAETEIISLELPQSGHYADRLSVRLKFTKAKDEAPRSLQ